MSRFEIYAKNKKQVNCGGCGKTCKRGEATKYYLKFGVMVKMKHFVCQSCHKSISGE